MSKDIVSGVGTRYGEIVLNDPTTGFPVSVFNSGTLQGATQIEGIKTFTYNDPDPQRFTHYGTDRPFAQDSLPATTVGDFGITTAKTNLTLDAYVSDTLVVTIDGNVEARVGNTNKKGFEPQATINVFRQALDTELGSTTFGRLRQWHMALIPSTRLVSKMQPMNAGITDKTYLGIPTPVTETPWEEALTDNIWGATSGEYMELTTTYTPIIAVGKGNGTLTTFGLPKTPIDAAHTHAWANGTLLTVSSVSTTDNTMTVSSPIANNADIFVILETNSSLT